MIKDPVVKYQALLKINNAIIREHTRSGLFNLLAQEISKLFHYCHVNYQMSDKDEIILFWHALL
jgi:hypothetical protein